MVCQAGDHIAVLPNQSHMMPEIEVLAGNLGLSIQGAGPSGGHASLDTPFDLEILDNLPPNALEGLDFGYAPAGKHCHNPVPGMTCL